MTQARVNHGALSQSYGAPEMREIRNYDINITS